METELREEFARRHGRAPEVVARAPGRLEILGNHTDYNEGLVISCATAQATWFAAARAAGDRATVYSTTNRGEVSFPPAAIAAPEPGDWANYVKGVVVQMRRRGADVPAFDACIASTVPLSAGMSSSAALEIATAYALAELSGFTAPPEEFARIGQACENEYVGARTGLLDQFSSIFGKANHLVQCDFRSYQVQTVPCPADVVFVVAESGVTHNLTEEYNERRERCEAAAAFFAARDPKVKTLRDVSVAQLEAARDDMDIMNWRRARHIVGENDRVRRGVAALRDNDAASLGALLTASHASSRENFENSCPELDLLVELGTSIPGCLGARLSGGGFGGISIHLVHRAAAEDYCRRLGAAWRSRTGSDLTTRVCAIGEGASVHV